MRVVHHHYSSGIDQWDGEKEREREEKNKSMWKEKIFWKLRWKRRGTEHLPTIVWLFYLDKYGVKQELWLFSQCMGIWVYEYVCGGISLCSCVTIYITWSSCLGILERNALVSCMDLFFNPWRWRHICQSRCKERIYCHMTSDQDEECEDDGTQGGPALPVRTFATARKEEGAPCVVVTSCGCRTRKNWASEDSQDKATYLKLFQKCLRKCYILILLLGSIRLNLFTGQNRPLRSPALLSYCC